MAAIDELGGVLGDEPGFPGSVHQPLEQSAFETALQKLPPKAAQNGRVEALIFEPYPQGMLPSEVKAHALFGFGIGAIVVVLQEHGEHHHRGRDGRPTSR
jgi:hypothetical protein